MSYKTALKIVKVVKEIHSKHYLLPSIQREFVWSTTQIEKLFDSLLMDYPINSFLFWEVPKDKVSEFKFYEFLREYHQKDGKHNPKADVNGDEEITAILDGQQRLTSLYIGLKGSYTSKLPRKRWDNPLSYQKRKLYLNLLQKSEDADMTYDFSFLTEQEVKEGNDLRDSNNQRVNFWFLVGEILNIEQEHEVNSYLIKNGLSAIPNQEQALLANEALFRLFSAVHRKETISYYLEECTELDKVLNIFIRVNSGGTPLSYSDLLLSFATAQWEEKDAREEINIAVDELNTVGRGLNLGKDLILKASLVLCDFQDISFKVDNFNRTNMIVIEKNWNEIMDTMRLTVHLVESFGFGRENITSNYSLIPIAYYIKSIGSPANFVESGKFEEDRKKIKRWFVSSLLLHVFSFAPDGVLKPVREIIQANKEGFPLSQIIERFKGTNRDITFTEDSINNLLRTKYGSGDVLLVLSMLYPWANLKNNFHIDHIFPKSKFTEKRLVKKGIPVEKVSFYMDNVNYLGNLQLLEEIPNKEKNNKDFDEWLSENYSDPSKLKDYKEKHYIPECDVSFINFEEFYKGREILLMDRLRKELM